MAGPFKTLLGALKASPFMAGISIKFGEEYKNAQDQNLPYVCVVPIGGPISNQPDSYANEDPSVEMAWGGHHQFDFYLWSASSDQSAQEPEDHMDAVWSLRQLVLSSLQDQRAQYTDSNSIAYGLQYTAQSDRWELMQDSVSRFGRCLVLSASLDVVTPMASPQEATVTSFQLTTNVVTKPS